MLQSIQNYDRLLEMVGYGRLITKRNNLIPTGYSPFVDSPGNLTINRNIENLPLRVSTDDGQLVLEAAMPGVNPKDIDIFVENDSLKISGKLPEKRKTEESNPSEEQLPRPFFQATVGLPSNVDPNQAATIYDNGLLTITIPKKLPKQGKRIDIQVKDNQKK